MSLQHTTISRAAFDTTLAQYPSTVPDKLQDLDTLRYETIPATLAKRREDGDAYLRKEEVEKLVEWKLKHGTFRPKLLQLVQSNPPSLIEETTRKAFKDATGSTQGALKQLTALKGIGPATASLLLSVHAPNEVPFFSDELFRWVMWDDKGIPAGWKRMIKYNAKEYLEVERRVGEVVGRLEVGAVGCERVAWVLGKEGVDVGKVGGNVAGGRKGGGKVVKGKAGGVEQGEEGDVKYSAKEEKTKESKTAKTGTKRKAVEPKAPVEGARRSRRKMDTSQE